MSASDDPRGSSTVGVDESPVGRVEKSRYYSAAFLQSEMTRVWPSVWLHAAALDLLPRPGSFVTVQLGPADVLLVRGRDEVVRAFHNVCLHRGRRLVDEAQGEAATLRCGLHHWQWNTDGTLVRIPDRHSFGHLLDDPPVLRRITCETWGGQAWVHLGTPEVPLREWLAPAVEILERYQLDDYALDNQCTFDLPCNWKAGADQFNEAYHVHTTHPYLLGSVDDTSLQTLLHGPHVEQRFTIGRPSGRLDSNAITDSMAELLKMNGVDPASLRGDARGAASALRAAMRGRGFDGLSDDELLMSRSWFFFPSIRFTVYAHMMQFHRFRPHPTDPERMWLDQLTFLRLAPGAERPRPRVELHKRPGDGFAGRVIEDDVEHLIQLQKGLHSPGFEVMLLGEQERCPLHMHRTLDRYLGA